MFVKTPKLLHWLYPNRVWARPRQARAQLTFDDGPIPGVTPWVLDQLKAHNTTATFFCIGENVQKHPDIFKRIVAEGHTVGNHTHNHLNGWKTGRDAYVQNVLKAQKTIESIAPNKNWEGKKLFRPPYGKMTSGQASALRRLNYEIVMWSVLSFDFKASVSPGQCFKYVSENLSPGAIIVFHDSLKAEKNLRYVLPKVLEQYYSIF